VFLGLKGTISGCTIGGRSASGSRNATTGDYTVTVERGFREDLTVVLNTH